MYLEGSSVVKANNETAFNYFKKAADKVTSHVVTVKLLLKKKFRLYHVFGAARQMYIFT
jgi:hypothetical protein